MNEAKLKACPFCGGDAESDMTQGFRRMVDGAMSKAVAIYCLKCSAQMTMCHEDHKEYAPEDMLTMMTEAWNIRAGGREPEAVQNSEAKGQFAPCPGCATLVDWLKAEMDEDEIAKINARDHGEWDRYQRLEGHRIGLLHVLHHIRAAQHNEKADR